VQEWSRAGQIETLPYQWPATSSTWRSFEPGVQIQTAGKFDPTQGTASRRFLSGDLGRTGGEFEVDGVDISMKLSAPPRKTSLPVH